MLSFFKCIQKIGEILNLRRGMTHGRHWGVQERKSRGEVQEWLSRLLYITMCTSPVCTSLVTLHYLSSTSPLQLLDVPVYPPCVNPLLRFRISPNILADLTLYPREKIWIYLMHPLPLLIYPRCIPKRITLPLTVGILPYLPLLETPNRLFPQDFP